MTPAQFKALKTGDLVRGRFSGAAFVVTQSHGDRVTAVRTQDLSNPAEWDLVDQDGRVIADAAATPAPSVPSARWSKPAARQWMEVICTKSASPADRFLAVAAHVAGQRYALGESHENTLSHPDGDGAEVTPAPAVPDDVIAALRAWSGSEPSQSVLAAAVDRWLAAAPAPAERNDSKRLNWLEAREASLITHREEISEGEFGIWWTVAGEVRKIKADSISGHPLGSARAAIDAAMLAAAPEVPRG